MSTGAGSSYLGENGAPRIEASVRINGTIGRNYLTQERKATQSGAASMYSVGHDEEGSILRYEWLMTNPEMEMTDESDDHNKAVVISSFNGTGKESLQLFGQDTEMAEHHLMDQFKPLGVAHNSCPFEPTETTYIESEGVNVMVAGLISQPSTERMPLGPFTLRFRNPKAMGEDQEYLPGKIPATKVTAVVKPLDPSGTDFARTLMMNMKWKLGDPATFDQAYNSSKSVKAAGKQKALDTIVDFIAFSGVATMMAFAETLSGQAQTNANAMVLDLANAMGFTAGAPNADQLSLRRSAARKAALTDESQIFGKDAYGYDPTTGRNPFAGRTKQFSTAPEARILDAQLNAHKRFYSAIAHLLRTLNPCYGRIVKSADIRGICEILLALK